MKCRFQIRLCIGIALKWFRNGKIAVNNAGVMVCLRLNPNDWVKPRAFVNTVVCIFNELGYIEVYTGPIENVVLDIVRTATCSSQWKLKDEHLQNILQLLPDFGRQYLAKKHMYDKRGGFCGGKPHTDALQSATEDDDTIKKMQAEHIEECLTSHQAEIELADGIYIEDGKTLIEDFQQKHCKNRKKQCTTEKETTEKETTEKETTEKETTEKETTRELTDIYNTLFEKVEKACENSSANDYVKQSLSKRRKITQPHPPDVLLVYVFVLARVYIKLYLPSVFHEDT